MKNRFFIIFLFTILCVFFVSGQTDASIISGTIDPSSAGNYKAKVLNDPGYGTGNLDINFGKFTTQSAYNISITDSGLSGYFWGEIAGWVVTNCVNTISGCSSTNGNFKVSVNSSGILSGYAWGQNTGWVNFGPFSNSAAAQVKIGSDGKFAGTSGSAGYAWSQNLGWIIFDCTDVNSCVETDYRSSDSRPQCSDGIDNDSDSHIDYPSDTGCTDINDNTEASGGGGGGGIVPPGPGPTPPPPAPTCATDPSLCPPPAPTCATDPSLCPPTPTCATDPSLCPPPPAPTCATDPSLCPPPTPEPTPTPEPGSESSSNGSSGESSPVTIGTISNGAKELVQATSSFVEARREAISSIAEKPAVKVTNDITSTTGIVAGVSIPLVGALFVNPLAFIDLWFVALRLWSLLLFTLGIKKRNKPWGTVYDSVTKAPLDPAYVVLYDMNGKNIATSITDIDGRYGFLVEPGTYYIVANKTNYTYPSAKLASRQNDEVYNDLYFGEKVEITPENNVLTKNIPMDQVGFDWNQFAKEEQSRMKFFHKRDLLMAKVSTAFFSLGFLTSIFALFSVIKPYNIAIFLFYIAMMYVRYSKKKKRPKGTVAFADSGVPLSYGILRIVSVATGQEIAHKILDKIGNYYCLIQNGTYSVSLEKKNDDETYTKIYTSEPIEVTEGFLKKDFLI